MPKVQGLGGEVRGSGVQGFRGFGVLGFWGFGVLGFWGFGVLGFWGFGVSGFRGFGVFDSGFTALHTDLLHLRLLLGRLRPKAQVPSPKPVLRSPQPKLLKPAKGLGFRV